jgi:hypothetical protein
MATKWLDFSPFDTGCFAKDDRVDDLGVSTICSQWISHTQTWTQDGETHEEDFSEETENHKWCAEITFLTTQNLLEGSSFWYSVQMRFSWEQNSEQPKQQTGGVCYWNLSTHLMSRPPDSDFLNH